MRRGELGESLNLEVQLIPEGHPNRPGTPITVSSEKETPAMHVMIQLREDAALELQNQSNPQATTPKGTPGVEQLLNAAVELGVRLTPVHPGQTHPLLVPYFMVEAKDKQAAEQIVNRLRQLDIVEAAYLRPDDEPP